MVKHQCLAAVTLIAALVFPAYADRARDAYNRGLREEHEAHYDGAYEAYKQAHEFSPNDAKYFAAYTRLRFNAAAQHLRTGQLLRNTGSLAQALAEFQRAVEIDGSSFIAQQELRRTVDMIRRRERQQTELKTEPEPAKPGDGIAETVALRPISNSPITLHMTVNSDMAYRTICSLAGLNVLIDPEYKPQKITIDLSDVTIREALDMVRLQSKTFWRPVLANTIFVAADSPTKRKEYEQNVMKTFYLRNITTPAELQEAANIVRQILDVSRVQLLQAQDALIVRGTPDQMVLAERLLADFDKPKSEVVIDIAVMEVSRDRLRTLGTNLPTTAGVGIVSSNSSSTSSGGTGTSATSSGGINVNVGGISSVGAFAVSVPSGGSFTALASDSNSKILQSPEIRVLNDEKAMLRIGDRVPIASGSFQPGIVGGGGVSPLISTQFQYLDVGVNIDITPHIHGDREVTLKMSLEISTVTGNENIGGISQPIIGQRRIEHEARLADGEVNLMGGILEQSETQSLSGYPWISKVPILKYLFGQDNRERRDTEIVFAITPHIVRSQDVSEDSVRTIDVGTANAIELRRKATSPAAASAERKSDPAIPQAAAPQAPGANAAVASHPGPQSQSGPTIKAAGTP
jgi:general secretion pathway protein D